MHSCRLWTHSPLFTKLLTPGLTHSLCKPLDDWLDWLIPTNHRTNYIFRWLTQKLKVWWMRALVTCRAFKRGIRIIWALINRNVCRCTSSYIERRFETQTKQTDKNFSTLLKSTKKQLLTVTSKITEYIPLLLDSHACSL